MDPKKLLDRLPRFDKDKPFRYLGRRAMQAMAEAATANMVIGQRTAPGRFLVVRLVEGENEKEDWDQQFSESRAALLQELERETAARDIRTRSALGLDLHVLTDADAEKGEAGRFLSTLVEPDEVSGLEARLREERELILPRRTRTLLLESEPPEAQAYVDNRPVGVTPCRVDDIPEGTHTLTFARPGYLPHEASYRVESGRGPRLGYRAVLEREPEMGALEVRTFPPGARVTITSPSGEETRPSPCRWRLPAGPLQIRIEANDCEPQTVDYLLPGTPEDRPQRLQARLKYAGPDREEVVGRLMIYQRGFGPTAAPAEKTWIDPAASTIGDFFRQSDSEVGLDEWDLSLQTATARRVAPAAAPPPPAPEPGLLGEKPLRRGVLLIGREDPGGNLVPDVRLFDPENSVSRGCHAWLWVYADRSTGADYNTFLIGNNSPTGIRVDGSLVMETRRLFDDSVVEIGNFRMRVVKQTPEPKVEFDLD